MTEERILKADVRKKFLAGGEDGESPWADQN